MGSDGSGQKMITSRPVLPPEPPVLGRWRNPLRAAGLAAGLGAVLVASPVLRPAAGPPALPLTVTAEVTRTGEVGPVAESQLLAGVEVRPGEPASATIDLVSQTWVTTDVTLVNTGAPTGAEEQVYVRLALGRSVIHDGTLAELREGSTGSARIASGAVAPLTIDVSIVDGAESTYQGRTAVLKLDLTATRVED